MALTRAQLLMGNDQQGAVLPGEVQAVKQGAGIFIDTDGTISVDATTVTGLVKLNRLNAFNGYVWPETKGAEGQVLTVGTGNNLTWANGGVFVNGSAPLNPEIGDLWFDCSTGQLLVYEDCTTGSPQWTSGTAGLPVLPANTDGDPIFIGGSGTLADPYICSASSASTGGAIVVNRVTVTDLAPFQFVQIIDLNAVVNGGRFTASNNVADGSGVLVFDLIFTDNPVSPATTVYTCLLKVGYGTVYIEAPVTLTNAFVLSNPGTITGNTQSGSILTYSGPTAAGGAPPYSPDWQWRLVSDDSILQEGGNNYTTSPSEFGENIYITVSVEDSEGQLVSGATPDFGPISKPPFPNPTPPTIPTTIGIDSCFTWDGSSTTLQSDGCLLFKVGAGSYTQGPTQVLNGNTVCTRWNDDTPGNCGNAVSGTFISGCLFDATYSTCGGFIIDRIPDALSFPSTSVAPNGIATSVPVNVTGNNAPAFITVSPSSTGVPGSYRANIGGTGFVNVPATGSYTLSVLPGQSLVLQFQVGATASTTYNFAAQLGDSTGNTTATFSAVASQSPFPTTPVTFPTTTSGVGSVGTSASWNNGDTFLTASGCIEFSVDGGGNWQQSSTQILNGDILLTRYKAGALCADNSNGQTIEGTVTNGTNSASTSLIVDRVPNAVTFNPTTAATIDTLYTTNIQTPAGYNSTGYVTLAAGATIGSVEANINNTGFSPVPASGSTSMPIEPGQSIQIRGTSGSNYSVTYSATIELGVPGNVSTSTWNIVVPAATPNITTPRIESPGDGATGVGTAAGVNITSSTYSAHDGAGDHASSSWEVYAAEGVVPTTSVITAIDSTPVFGYTFNRSVGFNSNKNSILRRTYTTSGNRKTFTVSLWIKRSILGTTQGIFNWGSVSQDQFNFFFNSSNQLCVTDVISNVTAANLVTTDSYTDTANWMHVMLVVNTTSAVSTNRIRLFVNGSQIVNFSTAVYYSVNADTSVNATVPCNIGGTGVPCVANLNGAVTGFTFVDGFARLPSAFGVLSGATWVPVAYTLDYGSNGFELLFNTNVTQIPDSINLGKDTSGNNLDFTPVGFFLGTTSDNGLAWYRPSAPTSISYLAVGSGGAGGDYAGNGGKGSAGGGGGGVIQNASYAVAGGSVYIPVFVDGSSTFSGVLSTGTSVTFDAQTAAFGKKGNGTPETITGTGGTSGAPQSNPGGVGSEGAGGGGGAGGTGGNASGICNLSGGGAGGSGITSSIRGTSEIFGQGGTGGGCQTGGNRGSNGLPGTGLPGVQSAGFIAAHPSSLSLASTGAGLTVQALTQNSVTSYTVTATTANTFALAAWLPDSPTPGGQTDTGLGGVVVGNYAVLDANANGGSTLANNNHSYVPGGGMVKATVPLLSGKYYWEIKAPVGSSVEGLIGLAKAATPVGQTPGQASTSWAYNLATGQIVTSGAPSAYGSAIGADQIFGIAFDADSGKLYFAINNVWQNVSNPVTSINPAFSGLLSGPYYPAFGGSSAVQMTVNFGQVPYVYAAPTGYRSLYEDPVTVTLTFSDNTYLTSFQVNDKVSEVGGDASGTVNGVNAPSNQMTLSNSSGVWTLNSTVQDDSRTVPAGYPTSDPPDPLLYTLIASVTESASDLTSFSVAKPPLDPNVTYYARVQYKSDPVIVTSSYSPFSKFTTGSL